MHLVMLSTKCGLPPIYRHLIHTDLAELSTIRTSTVIYVWKSVGFSNLIRLSGQVGLSKSSEYGKKLKSSIHSTRAPRSIGPREGRFQLRELPVCKRRCFRWFIGQSFFRSSTTNHQQGWRHFHENDSTVLGEILWMTGHLFWTTLKKRSPPSLELKSTHTDAL